MAKQVPRKLLTSIVVSENETNQTPTALKRKSGIEIKLKP